MPLMESFVKCQDFSHEAMSPQNAVSSRHKRSKSDSDERPKENKLSYSTNSFHHINLDMEKDKRCADIKRKPLSNPEVHCKLNREILHLEKQLKDQRVARSALEKELGCCSSAIDSLNHVPMPKSAKELIREIAVLKLEVMHLEQYLLSLYRQAFEQQITTLPPSAGEGDRLKQAPSPQPGLFREVVRSNITSRRAYPVFSSNRMSLPQKSTTATANEFCPVMHQGKLTGAAVNRTHSSLSYRSLCSASRMSPSSESLTRAFQSCHSQPLCFLEDEDNATSGLISLAEYLGTTIADHIPETPNKISEEMVNCMGAIYCKLADPPLVHNGLPPSPTSSFSSMSALSPQYLGDVWSPGCRRDSRLDPRLINPYQVGGLKEFSGPYNSMVEIPLISRDSQRLQDVEHLLQNYKSLLHRLDTVDPRKMKNEEKLAFWVNIHNALMMHAYLNYGIPQNNRRRASLLNKAKCIVGGRKINAEVIRASILGCRTHCSGLWLRTFLYPNIKFKYGEEWQGYAIEHPEPLLHFAVCSGIYSDPAVRIYTPKKLFQQMEAAKEEYIRATVGIWKEQKILLPKVIDLYAKDKGLNMQSMVDMIRCYLPETLSMAIHRCQQGRSHKIIEWMPHNFTFRYLLSRDLASPHINGQ